jgi:hypothetical protein
MFVERCEQAALKANVTSESMRTVKGTAIL